MIAKRFLATGIDLACCAIPFVLLAPLGVMINGGGAAPNGLVAQMAFVLGLVGSAALFALLNLVQGLRGLPTPGQKIAEIQFDRGGAAAVLRILIGGLFLLPGLLFSAWSLVLLYPAVLLIIGQSPSERLSGTRVISCPEKV